MSVVLAIAPYQVLPADSGERNAVVGLCDAISKYAECHVLSTPDNTVNSGHAFHLHRSLSNKVSRYFPNRSIAAIGATARKVKVTHLISDHLYLAPAAWHVSWEYGAPWYIRAHHIEREHYRQLGKWWYPAVGIFERKWMRKANGIFFTTDEDRQWAISHYKLDISRCFVAPFGVSQHNIHHDKDRSRQWIAAEHQVDPAVPWLYFIGGLGYGPNVDAVRHIIHEIAPRLQNSGKRLKILIGGKGMPDELEEEINNLRGGVIQNIGFIENLDFFLKGCDVMLNPITSGAGLKTTVIEALGYNKVVVSTMKGAEGVIANTCGDNLLLSHNGDWDAFCENIGKGLATDPRIPESFFQTYNWDNIAARLLKKMGAL